MNAAVVPFTFAAQPVRVVTDERGEPQFVVSDVARILGYRDAANAARLVEDDERGYSDLSTPGGTQTVLTVNESGLYALVFRSNRPDAITFRRWVTTEVLPQIRRTGSYVAPATDRERALVLAREVLSLSDQVAELQPAATAWNVLASADGDYSLREAAQILNRDPNIDTGQNRLMRSLRDLGMCDLTGRPYQRHAAHLRRRAVTYTDHTTGEPVLTSQIRVSAQGISYLHKRLGGVDPVLMAVPA